jgi:hypothetical protein
MSLKADRELRGQDMIAVFAAGGFLLKTVLHLQLHVGVETITRPEVDLCQIFAPANTAANAIVDLVEELLVPTKRSEPLRSEFVFRF